jgi:uncharacterized repeat protein (TIGR01451 family)
MKTASFKLFNLFAALIFGLGLSSVYALTESDFTNNGTVFSTTTEFEVNASNNNSDVLVKPKGLTVLLTADASGLSVPNVAGDVINYTIRLDNIGLLDLNDVQLDDSIIPVQNITLVSGDTNGDNIMDHDEVWVFTGTYTITQADLDSFGGGDGQIENTITVSSSELAPLTDDASVGISQNPSFETIKTVDESNITSPGSLLYTISVENTGNISLSGVTTEDTLPDGSIQILSGPNSDTGLPGFLDVGETWEYTIQYAVSQTEIDTGTSLLNQVSVTTIETGTDAKTATANTDIAKTPSMSVTQSVDLLDINAPSNLIYTITINNTGNLTLNDVVPIHTFPNGDTTVLTTPISDSGVAGALDVNETWTFNVVYNATQFDIDDGNDLVSSVDASALETADVVVSANVSTTITTEPAFTVEKTVDTDSLNAPGTLNYDITVTNTGNVSLNDISVVDVLPNGATATLIGPLSDSGVVDAIDVGESWEFEGTYEVSQAEIDLGAVRTNKVDVTTHETGDQFESDVAITTIQRNPSYSVLKTVNQTSVASPATLEYEIELVNTGNTTLTEVELVDTLPDGNVGVLTGPLSDAGASNALDVSETWIFTGSYDVTQTDIDAGVVLINAVDVSTLEAGTQRSTAATTVSQEPGISINKTVNEQLYTAAGEIINYSLTITNTGNTALFNIVVSDDMADPNGLSCGLPIPFTLLPGAQNNCFVQHTINEDDIRVTSVTNQASVTSDDPASNPVTADSNTVMIDMQRIAPVATDDQLVQAESSVQALLAGAKNDLDANEDLLPNTVSILHVDAVDTDADGDADSLTIAGEGVWQADNLTGEVTFTPLEGFTADPASINYQVADATGLLSNIAQLEVDYPQNAPFAKDDYKQNLLTSSPSNPTILNVLANNTNGPDTDSENDINVNTVTFTAPDAIDTDDDGDADTLIVAGEGVWTIDNATADVTFTPEAGFLLDPTPVTYTVSDNNGLVSNIALIIIDYPQNAPVASDDSKIDQPLGEPVNIKTVANDIDLDGNLDPASVLIIDSATDNGVTALTVPGEGSWSVHAVSGDITFTAEAGFVQDPTPIQYTVKDTTGLESNRASVTITFEEPVTLQGIVWVDSDRDGLVGANEERKSGWTLRVYNDANVLVATAITDADGEYFIDDLIPGAFTLELYNENNVFMDSQETDGIVLAGMNVNLALAVEPGGVVYDSISREPIAGVTLNIVNTNGDLLHEDCVAGNQQSQTTLDDGLYSFHLRPGAHDTCPSEGLFVIEVASAPNNYHPNFSSIIRQEGAQSCGDATLGCAVSATFDSGNDEAGCTVDTLPNTNACEVQEQPDPPSDVQNTLYFVEFYLSDGDRNVVFNHLPLDARINDAEILLTKSANKRAVSVGDLVEYTLIAENTKDVPAVDISIVDKPPASFSLVAESVRLQKSGPDGEFDTADDYSEAILVRELSPIQFSEIDLQASELARINYIMRVGTGVVAGEYANKASATGPSGLASNTVTATVQVEQDSVLGQATLIGKVFHDRDLDGTQDPAGATGIALRSEHYGDNPLLLSPLPGRNSINEDPFVNVTTVNMPLSDNNRFKVSTREGTRISVDENGTITEAHVGDIARGLNAQDIRVCVSRTVGIPTDANGITPRRGEQQDVLKIDVTNHGINEEGLPGVRLATVTGLLIETDAYGRYSIPDVAIGSTGIGRNFILKVDPATLPQGSRFTTENPYILRILNSSLNKINFGVQYPENDPYQTQGSAHCAVASGSQSITQTVEVSLGSVFFNVNEAKVRTDQRGIVLDIANKLREYGGGEIVIESHTDSTGSAAHNLKLAQQRAREIHKLLSQHLGSDMMRLISVEVAADAQEERTK